MISRTLNKEETDAFKSVLTSKLPSSSLGKFAMKGAEYEPIKFRTVNEETYKIGFIPTEMSQIVDRNNSKEVASHIIVLRTDTNNNFVWFIPEEVVEKSDVFPTLKQSFYESNDYSSREADYRYHFSDGSSEIAVPSPNPIERLEDPIHITSIEYIGGQFPRKYLLEDTEDNIYYLRERSGSIRLIDEAGHGNEIFNVFIGREHPGTYITDEEILQLVSAVEYITIKDNYNTTVSKEAVEKY